MPGQRRQKRDRGEDQRTSAARRTARKKAGEARIEELGPDRRTELAQEIEAKRFRGKPPSI
jgi:hypothetical protein